VPTLTWITGADTDMKRAQDGGDPVRAAQAAAAKALSGSHGSGGSLARASSSNSLSGQQMRQRDAAGATTTPPVATAAPAARTQLVADRSSAAEPIAAADHTEGPDAGDTPGAAAADEVAKLPHTGTQATDAESKAGMAGASEEPEAPATPSLEAEKVLSAPSTAQMADRGDVTPSSQHCDGFGWSTPSDSTPPSDVSSARLYMDGICMNRCWASKLVHMRSSQTAAIHIPVKLHGGQPDRVHHLLSMCTLTCSGGGGQARSAVLGGKGRSEPASAATKAAVTAGSQGAPDSAGMQPCLHVLVLQVGSGIDIPAARLLLSCLEDAWLPSL